MKTKIIFLIADLGGGGAEKVLVNLANSLPQDKYDVTIRTIFGNGVNAQFLKPHVKYSSLFPFGMIKGYVKLQKIFSNKFLYKLLVRDHYDIEIAFMMHVPTRAIGGSSSNAKKFAWSHIGHITSNAYRSYSEFIESYKKLDGIAFVSKDGLIDFNNKYFHHPYSRIVHNVIDSEFIINSGMHEIPVSLSKETLNICSVGRLCSQKGYIRLLEALGELKDLEYNNWHLYLIGDGEDKAHILNLSKELEISNNITILGFQKNPHRYVSKMDLFVCSSETEGYSTAVTEAVILGLPVLTTECSGMNEIFGISGAGKIVPNSKEGIKNGLLTIFKNPDILNQMKLNNSILRHKFDKQHLINEFEDFIHGRS